MRFLAFLLAVVLLAGCSNNQPLTLEPSNGPDSPITLPSEGPYKPVMAGTAFHGLGS